MAGQSMILEAAVASFGGTDFSDQIKKLQISAEIEEKDVTTFTSGGWKENRGGLKSGQVAVSFINDQDNGQLDDVMWAAFLAGTPIALVCRADDAAVGTNNPSWTTTVLIKNWSPISGAVGDVNEADYTWPTSGAITRAES